MKSRKLRAARVTEDVRLGRLILPEGQAVPGVFVAVDVANHSDGDQRRMIRSGERRTIKRRSRFEELGLHPHQVAACEWYADAHAQRYDTQGITARYGEGVKSGNPSFDHLPKTVEQEDALADFAMARAAISPSLLGLFERVVLHGGEIGSRRFGFAVAVEQLVRQLGGRA